MSGRTKYRRNPSRKQSGGSGDGGLLMLAGTALVGWFIYENYFAAPALTATAAPQSSSLVPAGTITTSGPAPTPAPVTPSPVATPAPVNVAPPTAPSIPAAQPQPIQTPGGVLTPVPGGGYAFQPQPAKPGLPVFGIDPVGPIIVGGPFLAPVSEPATPIASAPVRIDEPAPMFRSDAGNDEEFRFALMGLRGRTR